MMTFQDNPTLGKFNGDVPVISRSIDDRSEEIKAAYERIAKLEAALAECQEYFEDRADADCDQGGYIPNEEMKMLTSIDETLHGPGGF